MQARSPVSKNEGRLVKLGELGKFGGIGVAGKDGSDISDKSDGRSIPVSQYNPTRLDPDQWVRVARDAGFRYVLLITKHHDG